MLQSNLQAAEINRTRVKPLLKLSASGSVVWLKVQMVTLNIDLDSRHSDVIDRDGSTLSQGDYPCGTLY